MAKDLFFKLQKGESTIPVIGRFLRNFLATIFGLPGLWLNL